MNREDFNKWIDYLKKEGKVADIKVISYNEETNEANVLIKPIKTPEKIEIDWDEIEESGLKECEQCGERAWDGRICHSCGSKEI